VNPINPVNGSVGVSQRPRGDILVAQLKSPARVAGLFMNRRTMPATIAARLAHHAAGACDAAEVLRLAPVAAAQAAAVGAHREASVHLRAALRHAGASAPEERAHLQERLSYECYLIDDMERAIAERRAALDIWRSCNHKIHEGDALRWLSRLSWLAGRRAAADQ